MTKKDEKLFVILLLYFIWIQNIISIHHLYRTQNDENDTPKCKESRIFVSIISFAHSTQKNRTEGHGLFVTWNQFLASSRYARGQRDHSAGYSANAVHSASLWPLLNTSFALPPAQDTNDDTAH